MTETISVAAKWWADRLRSTAGIGDNGARDISNMMAMGMVRMIRDRCPPTEENAKRFEAELVARLEDAFIRIDAYEAIPHPRGAPPDVGAGWYFDNAGWNDGGVDISLKVDYHPDPLLYDALVAAGISENVAGIAALPLKTHMRASRRRIVVSEGYGAPNIEIVCLWGTSKDDQSAASQTHEASDEAYEAWRDGGRRGRFPESFNVHREERR